MANQNFLNQRQTPDNSILDINGRQTYLGNAFVSGTQIGSIGSTAETPYVLISNPSTSGMSMFIFVKKMTIVTTTSATVTFRYYANPTVTTAGTALNRNNLRLNASAPTSQVNMTQTPTVSANGAFIADLGAGSGGGQIVSEVLQIIDPGNSLLITVTESSATVPVSVEIVWYEIPYTTNIAI